MAPPTSDMAKNGTGIGGGNSNNSANNFFRLETFLATNPGDGTAIDDMTVRLTGNGVDVNVTGSSFAVVHYGAGKGGTAGGGTAIFSISDSGLFSFPSNGLGPNGFGGFSSVDLFKGAPSQVPDGGTTVMLFGTALSSLGLVRRYLKR